MFALSSAVRIYVAVQPVDMCKQFNGLWACAQETLREDPRSGAMFVFLNKDRDRLKIRMRPAGRIHPNGRFSPRCVLPELV